MISLNTKLSLAVKPNKVGNCLNLTLATNNDSLIKLTLLFSDALFETESLVIHPSKPSNTLSIPIKLIKNTPYELLLKVVVGHRSSMQDHVFELTHTLPRFASFTSAKPRELTPKSSVTFHTGERVNRVVLWLNQAFALDASQPASNLTVTSDTLQAGFISVRDNMSLVIKMGPENGGTVTIKTDSMELAGDVVQDLCKYLKIEELESVADFSLELEQFQQTLQHVEEYNAQRVKTSVDMADSSNVVKTLIIKAEDQRMLGCVGGMQKQYAALYDVNRELVGEYNKRANNHAELLASLKEVNNMIQKAARLRMGEAKARVVAACRKAIKANNTASLMKIIKVGQVA